MAEIHIDDGAVEAVLRVAPEELSRAVQFLSHLITTASNMQSLRLEGEIVLTFAKPKEQ